MNGTWKRIGLVSYRAKPGSEGMFLRATGLQVQRSWLFLSDLVRNSRSSYSAEPQKLPPARFSTVFHATRGMSLVELIIACAVLTLFMGVVALLLSQGFGMWKANAQAISAEDTLRATEDQMLTDLRKSNWTALGSSGESQYLYFSTTGTNYEQFYLYIPSEHRLYRQFPGGPPSPVADGISASFRLNQVSLSPFIYDLSITLSSSKGEIVREATFSVSLRTFK